MTDWQIPPESLGYIVRTCIRDATGVLRSPASEAGDRSTLTGGHDSTLTGGYASTLTGGDASTLTGGYASTLTGGYASTLICRWWDGQASRCRTIVAEVGEHAAGLAHGETIQAGQPYRIEIVDGRPAWRLVVKL